MRQNVFPLPKRVMLFVSHANPEDNDFARCLALQLASAGYPIWCDLTKLLGGEEFWTDIEHAIRHQTIRFLYVLSRTSNVKAGPLNELQVAANVHRDHPEIGNFVIPLLVDNLPHREINIMLARINAIPFSQGWASGLAQLLKRLEEDGLEKNPSFGPFTVANWWRWNHSTARGVLHEQETLISNRFPIVEMPQLRFHGLDRSGIGPIEVRLPLPHPAVQHEQYVVTFAAAESFPADLGNGVRIGTGDMSPPALDALQYNNILTQLLRQAWIRMIERRNLPAHVFANDTHAFFFKRAMVENDTLYFHLPGHLDVPRHRQIVGFKTMKTKDGAASLRYWHFGVHAKPIISPAPALTIRPHVLFSDDGATIWESDERLHRARRSQCRNWWNDQWRDRILASMQWLAGDGVNVVLEVGDEERIAVAAMPELAQSPVRYVVEEQETPEDKLQDGDDAYDESADGLSEFDDEFDEDE